MAERHKITDDAAFAEFDFRCGIRDTHVIVERTKVVEIMSNDTGHLDFLASDRLMFAFQKNIVKNRKIRKYVRWFEFAEKTRNTENVREDFTEFSGDRMFDEMMTRLDRTKSHCRLR